MLKRDRTASEKKFDKMLKSGMLLLGSQGVSAPKTSAQPSAEAVTTNPFPYYMRWGMLGRKGQPCKLVSSGIPFSTIEFEDGFRRVVDNRAIARRKAPCSSSSLSCSSPTSSSPSST